MLHCARKSSGMFGLLTSGKKVLTFVVIISILGALLLLKLWQRTSVVNGGLSGRRVFQAHGVQCPLLISGDLNEQSKARAVPKSPIPDAEFANLAADCRLFTTGRGYVTSPVSIEEELFPLAFSIVMFKDVEQFERLLRAIYRPQNFYCIHVDKKSNETTILKSVQAIANCFNNVFIAKRRVNVGWCDRTVLEAELSCMDELLRRYKKWKYFINLTGQEWPLKTNLELVKLLKVFNGANNIEQITKRNNLDRYEGRPPPPMNFTVTKGSVHITATREFIDYAVNNEEALKFLEWVKLTGCPEEAYFSSLHSSPHKLVPGAHIGIPESADDSINPHLMRFKKWKSDPYHCYGKYVHAICIFGVGDLPALSAERPKFFANKFHLNFEPLALDCIEEWLWNRTRDEISGSSQRPFNQSFYAQLDFVKHHI